MMLGHTQFGADGMHAGGSTVQGMYSFLSGDGPTAADAVAVDAALSAALDAVMDPDSEKPAEVAAKEAYDASLRKEVEELRSTVASLENQNIELHDLRDTVARLQEENDFLYRQVTMIPWLEAKNNLLRRQLEEQRSQQKTNRSAVHESPSDSLHTNVSIMDGRRNAQQEHPRQKTARCRGNSHHGVKVPRHGFARRVLHSIRMRGRWFARSSKEPARFESVPTCDSTQRTTFETRLPARRQKRI